MAIAQTGIGRLRLAPGDFRLGEFLDDLEAIWQFTAPNGLNRPMASGF